MLRVVVDTNIFVSALLSPTGAPAQVLRAWRERRFLLLTSADILAEIAETLSRFIGRSPYTVTPDDVDGIVALLKNDARRFLAGTMSLTRAFTTRTTWFSWPARWAAKPM